MSEPIVYAVCRPTLRVGSVRPDTGVYGEFIRLVPVFLAGTRAEAERLATEWNREFYRRHPRDTDFDGFPDDDDRFSYRVIELPWEG